MPGIVSWTMEVGGCVFPDDRLYDLDGLTWVKISADSYTRGITQLHSFGIGKVSSVIPKQMGAELSTGKSVAYIESAKYSGNIRVPLGGILQELNNDLTRNPTLLNVDPYGGGWVARLRRSSSQARDSPLLDSRSVCERVENSVRERGIRCFSVYPSDSISGIGGDCPETLKALGDTLEAADQGDSALLVTDNPRAGEDVPSWASAHGAHGFRILETRFEMPLRYYVIGKPN